MSRFIPDEIWIERSEIEAPLVRNVLARLSDRPVRVVDDPRQAEARDVGSGKKRLVLQRHRGSFVQACPAGTTGLVCCNYLVVHLGSNCPLDCSYCFLQEYVANNPSLKVFTNVDDALLEIDAITRAHPERTFRIGTGELIDSLALDPLTGLSRFLVPFAARRPNLLLELKTKTDCVEELFGLEPNGRVVVSWSVNAPAVIAAEEHGSASLEERLIAARRVHEAGYRIGFHFDPLIEFDGWEKGYASTVRAIFSVVDPEAVAWVSLGTLRLTPGLTRILRARHLAPLVLGSELVATADGKARVWRGLRLKMYRTIAGMLRDANPRVPLYLCMEPPAVWDRVMGQVPRDRELGARLAVGATW